MKNRNILYILITLLLFSTACNEVIEVDLNSSAPQIVIEALVSTNSDTAKVKITSSINYDKSNIFPPVSNALIELSDNVGNREELIEKTPGIYINTSLTAEIGKEYTLQVTHNGKVFHSTCQIPQQVPLDSISLRKIPAYSNFNIPTDSIFLVSLHFTDPIQVQNYYQVVFFRNKRRLRSFIFDDSFSNGIEADMSFYYNDGNLEPGDTVVVELRCIANEVYEYLDDLYSSVHMSVTPTNPKTNIKGAKLGYFSAHTSDIKSMIYFP